MKRLLALTLVVISCSIINGQSTFDLFSSTGLQMIYQNTTDTGGKYNRSYFFKGVVNECGEQLLKYEVSNESEFYLYIEGSKVYSRFDPCENQLLLMDFDLEPSDLYYFYWDIEYVVTAKRDTVTNDGVTRRLIELRDNFTSMTWIEGLGIMDYGFMPFLGFETQQLICIKDDSGLFHLEEGQSLELCDSYGCPTLTNDFNFELRDQTFYFESMANNADSFLWTFPDGTTSTEENPDLRFTEIGCHHVTLEVNNDCDNGPIVVDKLISYCTDSLWVVEDAQNTFTKMSFVDEDYGMAISQEAIYKTVDGGITWTEKSFPGSDSTGIRRILIDVDMKDRDIGMITIGHYGASTDEWPGVLMTYDGGENWETKSPGGYFSLGGVITEKGECFTGRQFNSTVYFSNDDGQTWTEKFVESGVNLIAFQDVGNGLVVGGGRDSRLGIGANYLTLGMTANGGDTWKLIVMDQYAYNELRGFYFFNEDEGFVGGAEGLLLKTNDGGDSWSKISIGDNRTISSFNFIDKDRGWLIGRDGLLMYTEDGGDNWEYQYCNNEFYYSDFEIIADQTYRALIWNKGLFKFAPEANFDCITSVEDNNIDAEIEIFPNPANQNLNILVKKPGIKYKIFDSQGKLVSSAALERSLTNIEISSMNSGIYLLAIEFQGQRIESQLFIKS